VTRLGLDVAWLEGPGFRENDSQPLAVYGLPAEVISEQKSKWEHFFNTKDNHSFKILRVEDIPVPLTEIRNLNFASYGLFPLTFSGKSIGTLKVFSRGRNFFSEDKQVLLQSYANLAAVALQNAWLFEEVRLSNRQLHALSQRLMKAQEEERLHLSRELHDESGQLLAALTVQLGLLDRDADHPEAVRSRINGLNETANMIRENLHRLAVNLRPASLDHLGLITALQQFIQEFSRQIIYRLTLNV